MLELKDGFVLYHGSYCEVKEPDLAKCAKRKDFGQGFYLTTSKEQEESFLRTSIAKAIATGTIEEGQKFGYISTFEFKLSENLETHIFENADRSLKNMGLDYIDLYYCHRFDPTTPMEETLRALSALVDQGKILYYGVSENGAVPVSKKPRPSLKNTACTH